MTEYVVLLPGDESQWAAASAADKEAMYAIHREFAQALEERGHKVTGGSELANSSEAKVLHTDADGNHTVTDGPYAETVEQLTGFYIVQSDDLDDLDRGLQDPRPRRGRHRDPGGGGRLRLVRFLVLMAEEDHFDRWEGASEDEQQAFFDGLAAFTSAVRERGQVLFGEALARPEQAADPARRRPPRRGRTPRRSSRSVASTWSTCRPRSSPSRPPGCCRCPRSRSGRYSTCDSCRRARHGAARRVGPAAGPARRAVPAPRPGRGRPRRRVRGGGPHLAGRRRTRPTPVPGCSWRPGAGSPTGCGPKRSPTASSRCWPSMPTSPRRRSAPWPTRVSTAASPTSGSGWCCSARTPRCRPRPPRR